MKRKKMEIANKEKKIKQEHIAKYVCKENFPFHKLFVIFYN